MAVVNLAQLDALAELGDIRAGNNVSTWPNSGKTVK
jgi:hypothetical protein